MAYTLTQLQELRNAIAEGVLSAEALTKCAASKL